MIWDAVIACYLFLAGMGAGAFVLAAVTSFVKPEATKVRMIGYIIAPVAVAVGCLLLMVDAKAGLHNPMRFFFIVTNLQSVMAWGVIILSAFIVVGFVDLFLMWKKKTTPKALDAIGIVLAVCTAAYTGLLLGFAPGFPLWNPIVLPILFIVSAASSGFASVLLIAHAMGSADVHKLPSFLDKAGLWLPVVEAVLIAALLIVASMASGSVAPAAQASVANMTTGSYALVFWLGLVAIGLIVPFAIEFIKMRKATSAKIVGNEATSKNALALTSEACVLVGAFVLRFLVIMAAVPMF